MPLKIVVVCIGGWPIRVGGVDDDFVVAHVVIVVVLVIVVDVDVVVDLGEAMVGLIFVRGRLF